MSIDVPQVPPRLDGIPHPPFQLLGLGEPAVDFAVPEHAVLYRGAGAVRRGGGGILEEDLDDKSAACGWLQGYFA